MQAVPPMRQSYGLDSSQTRSWSRMYPKHVHKALRRYLGIENSAGALRFPSSNTEDFEFFSASVEDDSV